MTRSISAGAAKSSFAELLREAEGGDTVTITRYGRPVAVLVPPQLAEALRRLDAAGPQAGLAGLVGQLPDGEELVEALEAIVERDAGRSLPDWG